MNGLSDTRWRDKQAAAKAQFRAKGGHRLLCNTGARFHVKRGGVVANALTYGRPWGSR